VVVGRRVLSCAWKMRSDLGTLGERMENAIDLRTLGELLTMPLCIMMFSSWNGTSTMVTFGSENSSGVRWRLMLSLVVLELLARRRGFGLRGSERRRLSSSKNYLWSNLCGDIWRRNLRVHCIVCSIFWVLGCDGSLNGAPNTRKSLMSYDS
jgi:hypothetical protein